MTPPRSEEVSQRTVRRRRPMSSASRVLRVLWISLGVSLALVLLLVDPANMLGLAEKTQWINSTFFVPAETAEDPSTTMDWLYRMCTTDNIATATTLVLQMAAAPHTASSTTDRLFQATNDLTWQQPPQGAAMMDLKQRGLVCPNTNNRPRGVVEFVRIHKDDEKTPVSLMTGVRRIPTRSSRTTFVSCLLGKLQYRRKVHQSYNALMDDASIHQDVLLRLFTILRSPTQYVLSNYRNRLHWDALWYQEYSNSTAKTLENTPPHVWADGAWWRHNLFTKLLATDTDLIWMKDSSSKRNQKQQQGANGGERPSILVQISKEDSDAENAKGTQSVWYQTALARLQSMPFFGVMERLDESFELMGYSLCFNATLLLHTSVPPHNAMRQRPVSNSLRQVMDRHFRLDRLLFEEAQGIFDSYVERMRRQQRQGVLCNVGRMFHMQANAEVGLECRDDD